MNWEMIETEIYSLLRSFSHLICFKDLITSLKYLPNILRILLIQVLRHLIVINVKNRHANFRTLPLLELSKSACVGETGGNSNTFCFGSSGTETIWDIRLLFTCVQTLVIWLYSSCKNIWKCQHQVVEIRLRKNDYRCYNRPRMRGQL